MLSYRHAYHAGNHADVFKHTCLTLLLQKLIQKDKPFTYVDTHAAAGVYQLNSEMAKKNREHAQGIDRLLSANNLPASIQTYINLVKGFRTRNRYPGSPAIAAQLLRANDKLMLLELHNNEFSNLKANMKGDARIGCHHRDAVEGVLALCPPEPKRGIVLIDPAWELADDYTNMARLLKELHKKWPVAVIALWYPLLARMRNKAPMLLNRLVANKPENLFIAELWVTAQQEEKGMHGSGMAFINLPWQVDEQIAAILPALEGVFADDGGGYRCEWLV